MLISLGIATALWLPCLHFLYRKPAEDFYRAEGLSPKARQLAARHLQLWANPLPRAGELGRMRASNAEWDFMGRSFLVWSLVNMGLREPQAKTEYLRIIDDIINDTLRIEQQEGIYAFLMPYARSRNYMVKPVRSLFLDGELALMMGARRLLQEEPAYRQPMAERLAEIERRWGFNRMMAQESYPNECWTFDHAVALAAFRVADKLERTDHSHLCRAWVAMAKERLVDGSTGLLSSSYRLDGTILDGPEGSTIWMVAHCLQVVDPDFAQEQYRLARKEMGRILLGFGFAKEWPALRKGPPDIDSGVIIPWLEVSAGSSGTAFIAAVTFRDWEYLRALASTLDMAAFPVRQGQALKYCASNQVGDAALLYAAVQGPLWESVANP